MEFEVEVEQMPKRLARDGADCALTDVREYCVQQFAEKCRTYARRTVYRSRQKAQLLTPRVNNRTYTQALLSHR